MDDIRFQEIQKHNQLLSETIAELKAKNESISKALNDIALPALKEYQSFSPSSLARIAQGAIEKISQLLK